MITFYRLKWKTAIQQGDGDLVESRERAEAWANAMNAVTRLPSYHAWFEEEMAFDDRDINRLTFARYLVHIKKISDEVAA